MAYVHPQQKLYTRTLEAIMAFNVIPREAVKTINVSRRYLRIIIRAAKDNGHIRQRTIVTKGRHDSFYVITGKGVDYLRANSAIPWVRDIPPFNAFAVFGKNLGNYGVRRAGFINGSAFMCWASGADVTLPIRTALDFPASAGTGEDEDEWGTFDFVDEAQVDTPDDGGNPAPTQRLLLPRLLSEARTRCEAEHIPNLGLTRNDSFPPRNMRFTDSRTMRDALIGDGSLSDAKDMLGGEYTGVLDSHSKSVLIYMGNNGGMAWGDKAKRMDARNLRLWRNRHALPGSDARSQGDLAAIIIKGPGMFRNLYRDTAQMRGDRSVLGQNFDRLYAIPMDFEGAGYLQWLMNLDDAAVTEDIVNSAVTENGYIRNDGAYFKLFPLLTQSGMRVAVGVMLDFLQVRSMEAIMNREPDAGYGIICLPWQEEYYRKLFPNASYIHW